MKYRVYYWPEDCWEKRKFKDYNYYPEKEIMELQNSGCGVDVYYIGAPCKYCGKRSENVRLCNYGKDWVCNDCFEKLIGIEVNDGCI